MWEVQLSYTHRESRRIKDELNLWSIKGHAHYLLKMLQYTRILQVTINFFENQFSRYYNFAFHSFPFKHPNKRDEYLIQFRSILFYSIHFISFFSILFYSFQSISFIYKFLNIMLRNANSKKEFSIVTRKPLIAR